MQNNELKPIEKITEKTSVIQLFCKDPRIIKVKKTQQKKQSQATNDETSSEHIPPSTEMGSQENNDSQIDKDMKSGQIDLCSATNDETSSEHIPPSTEMGSRNNQDEEVGKISQNVFMEQKIQQKRFQQKINQGKIISQKSILIKELQPEIDKPYYELQKKVSPQESTNKQKIPENPTLYEQNKSIQSSSACTQKEQKNVIQKNTMLSKEEILKEVSLIEEELEVQQIRPQTDDQINYDRKEVVLIEKIEQITDIIKQLEQTQDQDNQIFILTYKQQLQKAQKLMKHYELLKQSVSNSQTEYHELLKYFKLEEQANSQMIIAIQKRFKIINSKLSILKKSKQPNQTQKSQMHQFELDIEKLNRLKEILKSTEKEQKTVVKTQKIPSLAFIFQNQQIAKVEIDFTKSISQVLKYLGKIQFKFDIKFILKNNKQDKGRQVDPNLQLSMLIQKPFEHFYLCQIQHYIQVKFDNEEIKLFKKGTVLSNILKKQKIRGKHHFFFSDYKEYDNQTAETNLQLKQCEECHIRYLNKVHKSMLIPLKVNAQKAIQYIEFQKMELQKLSNCFISKVRIQNIEYSLDPKQSLFNFMSSLSKPDKIDEIIIECKIHVKIDLLSQKPTEIDLIVNSREKISKIKQRFQKLCNIDKKLQKWTLGGQQITNQTCFQELKIFHPFLRLEVTQIKNLEYYGFQKEQQINTELYTNFYIENDQVFKSKIEQKDFPHKSFQFTFRVNALSKIFSCIKKHCTIKTAIDSIKSIVANSNKRCDLWMPPISEQQTYFNENYVLLHILNSAKKELAIQLCRTYKNHSPIPLKTVKMNGAVNDMKEVHYWICTKSTNIVSIDIFQPVKGKSTLLNEIFKTNFQTKAKHPICHKSVFVKYDIYRNPNYLVDLIDVSSNSMSQKQKAFLCKHANIIMIHLYENQQEKVKKWVETHCKGIPIIYLYRESNLMNNEEQFEREMLQNKKQGLFQTFHIISTQKQSLIPRYQYKFWEVSNCINSFVVKVDNGLQNQKKWLLNKYFENKCKDLSKYTSKLRDLQRQFSTIVDLKLLSGNSENKNSIKKTKVILDLIDIQNPQEISNFMSKMKEFSRIQRTKNLYLFTYNLQKIKNILEKKNDFKIEERKQELTKYVKNLSIIPETKKTQKFNRGLQKLLNPKQSITYQILEQVYTNDLKRQLDQQIEKREFSIQNFWRILLYIYSCEDLKQDKDLKRIQQIVSNQTLKYFSIELQKGKTIELINGDTLEMPIKLFKNHHKKLSGKNIMMIAVVGGQSSGKSNLLNFLFGCDFLSSQGRCTSGVYMTYYEIQGENIPGCDGILVLDTEGLFSNHVRVKQEAKNFDNKLVLFLLKTVDIIIVNCQGEIKKDIQDILQLSFDSQLMKYQPGVKYPHFNIVLNMKPDSMNSQNITEIQTLRQNIVENNPEMEKYISSEQSHQLPFAFTSKNDEGMETFLNSIQRNEKIATKKFYEATRLLSLNLLNILKKRGGFEPRSFETIYDEMYSAWSTLLHHPILTQHVNKRLKLFEDNVQKYICQQIEIFDQKIKKKSINIPNTISKIDLWMQKILEQIQENSKVILDKFEEQFMSKSIETNQIAARYKDRFLDKLKSYQTSFKLEITQNKYKLALNQSQNRGLQSLNKKARQLRSMDLSQEEKQKQFQKSWSIYTQGIKKKIDRRNNSQQIFHNVQQSYNNHMRNNQIARLGTCGYEQSNFQTFSQYYNLILKEFKQKLDQISAIDAKQIEPIISISSQQTTDLKYKYFDMRIFFEPVPTKFSYYLNFTSLNRVIDSQEINKKAKLQINQSEIVKNFHTYFRKDMSFFGISCPQNEITKKLIEAFIYPPQIQSGRWSNKIYIDKYYININEKTFNKNFQIFTNFEKEQLQKYKEQQKDNKNKKNNKNKNNQTNDREFDHLNKNEQQSWNSLSLKKFQLFSNYEVRSLFQETKSWYHNWIGDYKKNFAKLLIQKAIQNYILNNRQLYNQSLNQIKHKYIQKSFLDLNKIGIFPKQFRSENYGIIELKCQFSPIQLQRYSQIQEIINQMSSLISKRQLKSLVSQQQITHRSYYHSQCIGYSFQNKMDIKQKFKMHKQLERYKDREYQWLYKNIKNKDFVNFVKSHIKFQNILEKIQETISLMKNQLKIQDYVQTLTIVLKKELQDFNLDLRQISHGVSIEFTYLVHDLAKKLIWKKLEIERINKIKQQQQQLNKTEKDQRKIFFDNLELNSQPRCRSSAVMFVNLYKQFVLPYIQKQKEKFLEQKKEEFLTTYTRKTIQDYVDTEMMNCHDPDVLIQYLRSPEKVLNEYFNNFLERKINQIEEEFFCDSKFCVIELHNIFKEMHGKYAVQDSFQWQVDVLFQQQCTREKDKDQLAAILKSIFIEVLMKGENITANYQRNKFQLKEQVIIEATKLVSNHINFNFLKDPLEFQIMNLAHFIRYVLRELEAFKKEIQQISKLHCHQILQKKCQLVLCDKRCPCCDRLCDVDMKVYPHHSIHQITSGHQMRAVKGMIVEKIIKGVKQQLASVIRCEDVGPKDTFQFYGQEYQWEYFKQLKSNQWNFDSKQVNKVVFQKIWNTCGSKLCEQFTLNGKPMKFIEYSQGNIHFIQQSHQNTEYIFAIDGSGSMYGTAWDDQIKSLKSILSEISMDSSNTASILVFNDLCLPFCKKEKPGLINVNEIQFPSGCTTPDPTFIEAAKIVRQINSKQAKNAYFFYISDGGADHPTEGIRQLLECKKQLASKKLQFTYTSILIGDCSYGRQSMQKINSQMGGRSEYVTNAGNLAQKMKEILRK